MAKVSAKDGIILIGGYALSPYAYDYDVDIHQDMLDATGFTEGWQNYVPGLYTGSMTLGMFWDSAANSAVAALKPLANKIVTVIPDGYALGNPAFSIHSEQDAIRPGGSKSDILKLGAVKFLTSGADGGPQSGWALAHETITSTTTGTGFDDPTGGAVTAACGGFLHIWTPCAADTYTVKIQHSTALGSGYVDLVTFTLNGSARGSEHITVASGTVNRYRRVVATRTGAAGNPFGYSVVFYHA